MTTAILRATCDCDVEHSEHDGELECNRCGSLMTLNPVAAMREIVALQRGLVDADRAIYILQRRVEELEDLVKGPR